MTLTLNKKIHIAQKKRGQNLVVFILIYHTFLSTSIVFSALGLSYTIILAINFLTIAYLLVVTNRVIDKWAILLVLAILILTSFKVINFGNVLFYKINLYLITTILLISLSDINEIKCFVELSSKIILFVLFGSAIALILQQIGLKPVFTFVAENGRHHFLYFTSFGHMAGSVLRPSGIYDEPGTLAFMTGGLLVLRQFFSLNQKRTLMLLAFGFVTFSLAFLVFTIIFVLSININKNQRTGILIFLFAITTIVYISGFNKLLEDNLFTRFSFSEDARGGLRGGRETLLITAYENLSNNDESLLWGVNPYCTIYNEECLKNGYMGENPLAPIAYHGIFIAWPYYLFIIITLIISIKGRKYLIYLALMSLFIQRPYLLNYGVSMLGVLPLFLYFSKKK